ncbi:hypothetical protein ABZS79_33610 [Streptomyces griseoloalbus]|uniref:hypothetical protein n=1 Tax=Streptomyces griseoloalbus TaxID=67303 RepID=UPI0033B2EE81
MMRAIDTTVYAMLPVRTGAVRAEAAALAQEVTRQLADQGIDHPADQLVDLIRSQATVTGLYDDGELAGCLVVRPDENLPHWSRDCPGPGVWVSLIPPVPGRDDQVARLLTLWLADHAAQHGLKWVWWEAPATAPSHRRRCWRCSVISDGRTCRLSAEPTASASRPCDCAPSGAPHPPWRSPPPPTHSPCRR